MLKQFIDNFKILIPILIIADLDRLFRTYNFLCYVFVRQRYRYNHIICVSIAWHQSPKSSNTDTVIVKKCDTKLHDYRSPDLERKEHNDVEDDSKPSNTVLYVQISLEKLLSKLSYHHAMMLSTATLNINNISGHP